MRFLLSSSLYPLILLYTIHTQEICAESAEKTLRQTDAQLNAPQVRELVERDGQAKERLSRESPIGVRKMTDDEGEKFWLNYWYFGSDTTSLERRDYYELDNTPEPEAGLDTELVSWTNGSSGLHPAFPLHGAQENISPMMKIIGRSFPSLQKRHYRCPSGTEACDSINRPNSCCERGSVCQLVKNTGLGDVGCCGKGDKCAGELGLCDYGYSSCPGGGCCIPGYKCVDQGCLRLGTTTVYATPTATYSPPPPSSSSTNTPIQPPVRPTSNPTITITSTDSSSSASQPYFTGYCPTGYYACQAVYHGGCCRTGRDCNPTSCPAMSSTTVVDSHGATIVIPLAPTETSSAKCAQGWSLCSANVGGGCCPEGFDCGNDSCTAPGRGSEPTIGKLPAQNGAPGLRCLEIWESLSMVFIAIMSFFV